MRIRIPSRDVCERFSLTYELYGGQRGADFLTKYYRIRRMKIILDGRRVMRTKTHRAYLAHYYRNKAYFTKRGLKKRYVLHELYHHIVEAYVLEMTVTKEESGANEFVRKIMKKI
jgi:ribosomal protein L35